MSQISVTRRLLVVEDAVLSPERRQERVQIMGSEWDVLWADSAAQGLQAFTLMPFDAVLADLDLPGMGGAQFLQEIMARYPATVRIVLFADGQRPRALQCAGWAHQFLAKPWDPAFLKALLRVATVQGAEVGNGHVRELVARIGQLPVLPENYREITQLLESEHGTTEALGEVIAKDLAMTAMVLKLSNSAFLSLRHPVSDPGEAAAYLGVDLLKSLVLAHGLFSQVGAFRIPTFTIQHLWAHSLAVATGARLFAEMEGAGSRKSTECFTAGILHDVGLLILASRFPEDYVQVLDITRKAGGNLEAAEQHVFGATHGEVGAYLLALWGLPAPLIEAAANHHVPGRLQPGGFTPAMAVHVADALQCEHADHEVFTTAHLDLGYLSAAGFLDRVPAWRAALA
jgi:HD-like signal output (HDOD) protein/ActR/RegA family two-component response regulator